MGGSSSRRKLHRPLPRFAGSLIGAFSTPRRWIADPAAVNAQASSLLIIVSSFFRRLQSICHVSSKLIHRAKTVTTRFLGPSRAHKDSRLIYTTPENSSTMSCLIEGMIPGFQVHFPTIPPLYPVSLHAFHDSRISCHCHCHLT